MFFFFAFNICCFVLFRIWSTHFCSLFGSTHCFVHSKSNSMWAGRSQICTLRYHSVETGSLVARQTLLRVWSSVNDLSCWISRSPYKHTAASPTRGHLMGYWDGSWRASSIFHLKGRFVLLLLFTWPMRVCMGSDGLVSIS